MHAYLIESMTKYLGLKKIFLFFALLSMLVNSVSLPFYSVSKAYAQETEEVAASEPEGQNELTPTETQAPVGEVSPTPSEEPTPENSPTPKDSVTVPFENQENNNSPNEELNVVLLDNVSADSLDLETMELGTIEKDTSATLTTDKDDYAPTDAALISGSGFNADETYKLVITSQNEPPVHFETQVAADENGAFIYAHQLDGKYRPNYLAEVKDSSGQILASTTFTDAAPTLTITRSGGGGGTVTSNDGFINCVAADGSTSGACSHTYGSNNPGVILTAVPDASSSFDGWVGGTCAGSGTCTPSGLTENNEVTVEAIFNALPDNTPPLFDPIADQTVDENSPSQNISITNISPGSSGESGQAVTMSATSSDSTIIPNPSVSGSGSTRTLSYTPATNEFGTVTITVTAYDGQPENNTYARTFTITVNQDTTPPTGVITIDKIVEGGDVPSSNWEFSILGDQGTGEGTVASGLHDGDSVTLPVGTYTVSESTIAGYALTAVGGACSDINTSNATLTVTGEGGTCTLTNTQDPVPVRGFKYFDVDQNGSYDGSDYPLENWTLCLNPDGNNQGYPVSPSECQTTGPDGLIEWTVPVGLEYDSQNFGAYHGLFMQESNQDGWTNTFPPNGGFNVDISFNERGEVLYRYYDGESHYVDLARFGNWQETSSVGSITIIKDVQPGEHRQNFGFVTRGEGLENFKLDDDGNNENKLSNTKVFENLAPGEYRVRERNRVGWIVSGILCEGDNETSEVNLGRRRVDLVLDAGENIICTFINEESEELDVTPPVSTFSSPEEDTLWNSPIEISGSSTDVPNTTVEYVSLFYSVGDGWNEFAQLSNEELNESFNWSYNWEPDEDGTYDIKAEATDTAGNSEQSPTVAGIVYDTTGPETPSADPAAGDYDSDKEVTLESSDSLSGISDIFYTIDGSTPDNSSTAYTDPIVIGVDTALKAIAYDNAGNPSDVLTAEYGIAPVISEETSSSLTETSGTITWSTDDPATSRVLYDTVSHAVLDDSPNYGYANSTVEADTDPKVTDHSVVINGLTAGTTYFYRTVSHGSPEAVSDEHSIATASPTSTQSVGGTSIAVSGSTPTAPSCNDSKPGSAPTLLSSVGGLNSVALTWSEALDPVSYYLITYGTTPGAQMFGNPNIGGKGTTSFTVNNLSGGTIYYFKVRAGNGCAPGEFSNELSQTPSGGIVEEPATGFTTDVLNEEAPEVQDSPVSVQGEENSNSKGLGIVFVLSILLLLFVLKKFMKMKRLPV